VSPQAFIYEDVFLFAWTASGGFQGSALFAYFFHAQFGASEAAIGMLFVGARIMNAFSHLGAAWLARASAREYMVFTHTPSSLSPSPFRSPEVRNCGRAVPPAEGSRR